MIVKNTTFGSELMRHFDALRIINLPSRLDRRNETTAELARIGLVPGWADVEFFPGIRGRTSAGFASPGAHGAFLSHLTVLQESLDRGDRAVLIAEDDLTFLLPPASDFSRMLSPLGGDDWDFFFAGYHYTDRFVDEGTGLINVGSRYDITGLHLYGVHHRILPALLQYLKGYLPENHPAPIHEGHIDGLITSFRGSRTGCSTLVLSPAIATQRRSRSDVQQRRFYDRLPGLGWLISWLRKVLPRRKS